MEVNGANSSRSSSPTTPESLSDGLGSDHTAPTEVDLSAWCHASPESESIQWRSSQDHTMDGKLGGGNFLMLEDIMQENAYQTVPPVYAVNPAVFQMNPSMAYPVMEMSSPIAQSPHRMAVENSLVPVLQPWSTGPLPSTRPIPPPPAQPRKFDSQTIPSRVIFPPRESCQNLAILTPSIPASGTKSRVETQIRVQLDLAHILSSSGDAFKYDRVGSWKWLKLQKGTFTRRRSRKEGKIDATPEDTLYLEATVVCSTAPHNKVNSCSTCKGREAKRVARKIAARVRPTRSDSDTNDDPSRQESEDQTSVIQFNCSDTLDFSSGSVVLPLRITCYCRHHREKVGFMVQFTMQDELGHLVGKGVSPPIMITDDHKSTGVKASALANLDGDWDTNSVGSAGGSKASGAPSKRRQASGRESSGSAKKRAKPYEAGRTSNARLSVDEQNVNYMFPGSAMSMEEFDALSATVSVCSSTAPPSPKQERTPCSLFPSPSPSYASPVNSQMGFLEHDIAMFDAAFASASSLPMSPPRTAPPSPPVNRGLPLSITPLPTMSAPIPLNLYTSRPEQSFTSLAQPKIHRLIPSSGPTYGGIEVTVLGANFHSSMTFNCVFGDTVASTTSRWSDNTLVCILPPRACSGMVPVTLDGLKMDEENGYTPPLFTYVDESHRALMELALQVVGLKMTGKIEDAKSIAIRIVGSSAQETPTGMESSEMTNMQGTSSRTSNEYRRLLLSQGGSEDDFEKLILDFLRLIDVPSDSRDAALLSSSISHPMSTGQTLLHLSSFLNFPRLVEFLIDHGINLDVKDLNGCTALHFASFVRSQACTEILLEAGADSTIMDASGRIPATVTPGFFESCNSYMRTAVDSDEESQWADVEESNDEHTMGRSSSHALRLSRTSLPRSRRQRRRYRVSHISEDVRSPIDETIDEDDAATVVAHDSSDESPTTDVDEKTAATFAAMLQRAWSQIQPPQFMPQMPQFIPQMPQMPQMPHLRDMPTWVFPVFVPMPAWPALRSEKRNKKEKGMAKEKIVSDDEQPERRISWEKWVAQMTAMMVSMQRPDAKAKMAAEDRANPSADGVEEDSVPVQTTEVVAEPAVPLTPAPTRSILRRFGYGSVPITDQDVNAYTYRPKRTNKMMKKEDRMLILFWIPILILAIGWALYIALPFAYTQLQEFLPLSRQLSVLTLR